MANEFAAKYTEANVTQDAAQYDSELFLQLHDKLDELLSSRNLATALIAVILCGQRRGDIVVKLFHDVAKDSSQSEVELLFTVVREAIMMVVPIVGLPNCMPACFGLVNELKGWGIENVPAPTRDSIRDFDYTTLGLETVTSLYRGVGNPEVRQMIQQYFPEMSYFGRTTIWGFLVGASPIFELKDAEILVAGAITALGATRQARSHVKCCLSVGNNIETVSAMIEAAREIAAWNRKPISGEIDVQQLAEERERNLVEADNVG